MHSLNGRYATWFNSRHDYKGHLFESRFHAVEIVTDWHLLEAVRYVVLNPVRAGLCERPEEWVWSSYRASIGSVAPAAFFDVERLLDVFGPDEGRARLALRQFVENALPRSLAA